MKNYEKQFKSNTLWQIIVLRDIVAYNIYILVGNFKLGREESCPIVYKIMA